MVVQVFSSLLFYFYLFIHYFFPSLIIFISFMLIITYLLSIKALVHTQPSILLLPGIHTTFRFTDCKIIQRFV